MAYTREEAEFRFKERWREMQEKGLPEAFDINHLIEDVIYKAFLWASLECTNLPFILDILNTMTKETKEIEKMNSKIKKK